MDQDFIIHINRQERTQAMEGVELKSTEKP